MSVSSVLDWDTLGLHPLLVSKMRDKHTTIPILDASLLPDRPDRSDGFLCRDWALEMRRIGRNLAYKSHQSLRLFWSNYGHVLAKYPWYFNLKDRRRYVLSE